MNISKKNVDNKRFPVEKCSITKNLYRKLFDNKNFVIEK